MRHRSPLTLACLLGVLTFLYLFLTRTNQPSSSSAFSSSTHGSSKIIQLSMLTPNVTSLDLYERCLESHLAHGKKWGYPTHVLKRSLLGEEQDEDIYFSKELFIQATLAQELAKPSPERAEWIFWFDADSLILNPHIPLDIFLPPSTLHPPPHFLATKDHHGLNTGHFFLRIHPWTSHLLSSILATPYLSPTTLSHDTSPSTPADQTALTHLLTSAPWRTNTAFLPIEWFNQFDISLGGMPGPEPGTLLVHFVDKRRDADTAMRAWLARLKSAPKDFQPKMKDTTYEEEVRKFWARVQSARTAISRAEEWIDTFKKGGSGERKGVGGQEGQDKYEQQIRVDETKSRIEVLRDVLEEYAYIAEEVEGGQRALDRALSAAQNPGVEVVYVEPQPAEGGEGGESDGVQGGGGEGGTDGKAAGDKAEDGKKEAIDNNGKGEIKEAVDKAQEDTKKEPPKDEKPADKNEEQDDKNKKDAR